MEARDGSVSPPLGKHQVREDSSTRSWDEIADDWIVHADKNDYRNYYLMPRLLAMLGSVAGKRILDLGCGGGGLSRHLAHGGADVVGGDAGGRLAGAATEPGRPEPMNIEFL